jgi:hypothetical protein
MNKQKLEEEMTGKFDEEQIKLFINFIDNEKRLIRKTSKEDELNKYILKGISEYCENRKDNL